METINQTFTVCDDHRLANATCLQGYVNCSYDRLVDLFGTPLGGDGYKTQAEWVLKLSNGDVATIYDWKENIPPEQVTEWHIGGHAERVVNKIKSIVKG
jgi:hypothetical protein